MRNSGRLGFIQIFVVSCAAATLVAGAARAQGVPFPLILVCSLDGPNGPEVRLTQSSRALVHLCEDPGEDDFVLCQTIDAIEAGSPCAAALSSLDDVGTNDATNHSKLYLPSNFSIQIGGLPPGAGSSSSSQIGSRPFEQQLDVVYALKSASHEASLVSCDFSPTAPRVVGIQSSAMDDGSPPDASSGASCADGLQLRFDSGEGVVDAVEVHGWNPAIKKELTGKAEPSSSGVPIRSGTPPDSIERDLNRVIYLYTVVGADSQ